MNESYINLSIKKRAKTFYFASLFFSRNIRNDIEVLYLFCRLIDDIGDEDHKNIKSTKKNLKKIKKDISNLNSDNKIVSRFIKLMFKYKINALIPNDLIDGVISDLEKVNVKSLHQLIEYSYRVAGTVGLMMCKIMNIKEKKLKKYAIQLGIAMQITNIARDVKEDLQRNRIYIPKEFRLNINKDFRFLIDDKVLQNKFSHDLEILLQIADEIYNLSWKGILHLPIKFRIPIAIASFLYQSIGIKIRSKSYDIWSQRIYLSKTEKFIKSIQVIFNLFINQKHKINIKLEENINKILFKIKSVNCD
jgi:phytoene synthase